MIDLDVLVRSAYALAPLPTSVTRLASIISRTDWSPQEVEDVISLDPALTANLLRLANSAAFGSQRSITSVRQAVVRLGVGSVLSLAVAASVQSRVDRPVPEFGLSPGELWRHSVLAALAAEQIASDCERAVPQDAYTAALLHDLGKLVIARFLAPEIRGLLEKARAEGGLAPIEAESEVLSVHHGEIGGLIAQHWRLPEDIVEGIQYHHDPAQRSGLTAHVTHVANLVAHHVDETAPSDGCVPLDGVRPESCRALGLPHGHLEELAAEVGARADDLLAAYA